MTEERPPVEDEDGDVANDAVPEEPQPEPADDDQTETGEDDASTAPEAPTEGL